MGRYELALRAGECDGVVIRNITALQQLERLRVSSPLLDPNLDTQQLGPTLHWLWNHGTQCIGYWDFCCSLQSDFSSILSYLIA